MEWLLRDVDVMMCFQVPDSDSVGPYNTISWSACELVPGQGLSLPPLASILPLGEIAKLIIGPVCPCSSVMRRVRRAKSERIVCSDMGAYAVSHRALSIVIPCKAFVLASVVTAVVESYCLRRVVGFPFMASPQSSTTLLLLLYIYMDLIPCPLIVHRHSPHHGLCIVSFFDHHPPLLWAWCSTTHTAHPYCSNWGWHSRHSQQIARAGGDWLRAHCCTIFCALYSLSQVSKTAGQSCTEVT